LKPVTKLAFMAAYLLAAILLATGQEDGLKLLGTTMLLNLLLVRMRKAAVWLWRKK
jgi:hypothetical protein